jgi:hypothetical protein
MEHDPNAASIIAPKKEKMPEDSTFPGKKGDGGKAGRAGDSQD